MPEFSGAEDLAVLPDRFVAEFAQRFPQGLRVSRDGLGDYQAAPPDDDSVPNAPNHLTMKKE
jgi:hypothetical protein